MRSLFAVVVALCAHAAAAQRTTDTQGIFRVPKAAEIPDGDSYSIADRGRVAMVQFARCVVDSRRTKLQVVLSMPIGPRYEQSLRQIATDNCLTAGSMNFQPMLFRGALFAELWRRRVDADLKGKGWGPVLDPIDFQKLPTLESGSEASRYLGYMLFADCVVKRDRAAANDVIVRPTASREQAEAYERLRLHLGPCLMNGQKVEFSKPVLEGILAEVLYRSTVAPSANGVH